MSFDFVEHKRQIQAFYPIYLPNVGNATQIETMSGESYVLPSNMRTFLHHFTTSFAVNKTALQQKYGPLTGQKNLVALPLGLNYVFLPLQLRQPRIPGDGSIGYVQLHRIVKVAPSTSEDFKSILQFADGRKLDCLNTPATVQKHMHAAHYIYEVYLQEFCGSTEYREILALMGFLRRITERSPLRG